MRYSKEMEQKLVEQIRATPDSEVFLPEWASWKGRDQPYVYVKSRPTPLGRRLYEVMIGPLPSGAGLRPNPGTSGRNVNPYLMTVTPSRSSRTSCKNGHPYAEEDWVEGRGYRCQICRKAKLKGTPSPIDINRQKTVCPKGHALVLRKDGTRRCKECPRDRSRARRAALKNQPPQHQPRRTP